MPSICVSSRQIDPNPTFWSVYWRMWAGPRPLPGKNAEQA